MTRNLNPAATMEKGVRRMAKWCGEGCVRRMGDGGRNNVGGTATLRASVPADDAGVGVESGVGHPLVHAAVHEARNAHDSATTRIQRAKLAEGAHTVTLLCAGSDGVGGKRHRCHGTKDEMHCSRHRDAAVRAEPAPIRSDECVQIGVSCARPLDDLEHVGHAAADGCSNGQGSPGVHGFDGEMDHRPRCSSPNARQIEPDHERDDPHYQNRDSG